MAWHRIGDIIWNNADPIYWRIYAALGGDKLIYSWGRLALTYPPDLAKYK